MSAHEINYNGSKLRVMHHGAGWKVFIYLPGSNLAETKIPNGPDQATCIAEAKQYVDQKT